MIDEEKLAEEWLDEKYLKDMGVRKPCKEAYLAGLKAGREIEKEYVRNNAFTSMKEQGLFPFGKWHRLSAGDIPKENKLYLVKIKDNGLAIAYFNGQHWETRYNIGDYGHCVETVIAWCELPKFEE